jgi:hypothetical protein
MSTARSTPRHRGGKARRRFALHKANGVLHPRVQTVGPEHFGLVCCDCASVGSFP